MKLAKTSSVEELQVISRFESLRRILLSEPFVGHLDKPLAYWALPTDRRLPLAFLGRSLKDLLQTPFAELSSTPGIGQKKIRSFVKLLSRVANTDPSELPVDLALLPENGKPTAAGGGVSTAFDPAAVSEVVWSQWRQSVLEHSLGKELLGRLAPSLKNMTRVIWNTPLEAYAAMTLAEIRGLKTHGEKRIRAILEVFHSVHGLVAAMGAQEHLVLRIVPRLIDSVETWAGHTLQQPGMPCEEEIFVRFVHPLLKQVRGDATRQIASLAESRLGINGPVTSVRQAARAMGLTRARVYQLLNEINDIMNARWPMGRHQVYQLHDKFQAEAELMDTPPNLEQFHAAVELFYPGSRRGAAGPLDRAEDTAQAARSSFDSEEPFDETAEDSDAVPADDGSMETSLESREGEPVAQRGNGQVEAYPADFMR